MPNGLALLSAIPIAGLGALLLLSAGELPHCLAGVGGLELATVVLINAF
jgi:hypothetical protein